MKVIIHRGSQEIGGTCIEISTDSTKLLLDIGKPLNNDSIDLSYIAGKKYDAIIISHAHQDHYGLIDHFGDKVPIYIGKLSLDLINASRIFLGKQDLPNNFQHFKHRNQFEIGDVKITPFLVDHSATDAYSLLLEAREKRIFYSGDFRSHGKKSMLFDQMIQNPPQGIDLMFMEGTMFNRSNSEFPDEKSVESRIIETIKYQSNISFIISSSQNIDRLVSAYRACKQTDKLFVIDLYTAWVLEQMKQVSSNVPNMDWQEVKVYFDFGHYKQVKANESKFGDFLHRALRSRVEKDELERSPQQYLVLSKMSKYGIINRYKRFGKVNLIYSQWKGYLQPEHAIRGTGEIAAFQTDEMINFVYAHTSGHATVDALKHFAEAISPKRLIPVHTEYPEKFKSEFENVVELKDGEIFEL
ncbi:MAG: Ribonuclease J [Syntrophomonadaceae bacterium]|nr:Ribonuclease J [Bacillota bacterium]